MSRRNVSVVVQTHWDREWYYPHQSFVARLIAVMSRVVSQLESGQLNTFLFDGQTAAYEDLIANCEPELALRVRALVRKKRIILGPWYVMADEFLVAGESLIRNLEIGMADAATAGNGQMVGYLPDTFGHISQMPQILRSFSINAAVLWRGADAKFSEFDWQALDGSVVGTVFLTQGYYQHPLNVDDWQASLLRYLAQIEHRALSPHLLLTQGGDHLVSANDLAAKIEEFNKSQDKFQLHQNTLADYVDDVMIQTAGKREQIVGELRRNAQAFVLPDVLSSRRYLKLLNQTAEDKLLGVIEPLYAQLKSNEIYPTAYLEKTWRLLIQQHAHDSICGCSVDVVHREMLTRFAQLDQRLDALVSKACTDAGMVANAQHNTDGPKVFADDLQFTIFNPLPKRFTGWITHSFFIAGEKRHGFSLVTADEKNVERTKKLMCDVLSIKPHAIFRSPVDDFPDRIEGHLYEVAICCEVGGLSALACDVIFPTLLAKAKVNPAPAVLASPMIENESLRVVLNERGELGLFDKASGVDTPQFLSFLSELDAGDSYNFSPPPVQQQVIVRYFSLESINIFDGVQELILSVKMVVPESLSANRQRASEATVTNVGQLRLRLYAMQRTVDAHLTWTNHSKDQRTRLLMPISNDLDVTCSDSAFSWERRPITFANYPAEISRREMPIAVNPSYSAIQAGDLFFCHRAMQEYEIVKVGKVSNVSKGLSDIGGNNGGDNGSDYGNNKSDESGKASCEQFLAVTMVRSVGWMSRRDLVTRGVGAGPDMETPEAQCLGTEVFDFQIGRISGESPYQALNSAQTFRRGPVVLRGHTFAWRSGIEINNAALQVSATRLIGDELEIRLWNPTNAAQQLKVSSVSDEIWRMVNADGRSCGMPSGGAVTANEVKNTTPPVRSSAAPALVIEPFAFATLRRKMINTDEKNE